MLVAVSRLMIFLAVVAVGMAQVFGMRTGFLCDCTGERSSQESCVADDCHPDLTHKDGCGTEATLGVCADLDHDGGGPASQDEHPHKHSELRKALVVTGVPPLLALPAVTFVECSPFFQRSARPAPLTWPTGIERPVPAEDGSPPMPLLVARTVVRLV